MAFKFKASFDKRELAAISGKNIRKGMSRAMVRAKATSLRTMKSETKKRVRRRKAIKVKDVDKSLKVEDNKQRDIKDMAWGIRISGRPRTLMQYSPRPIKKGGISVMVNRGKRTKLPHAFIAATNRRGQVGQMGIFQRKNPFTRKIRMLLGSRPVDAMLHKGEADGVREAGRKAFIKTAQRNLKLELDKA